MSNHLALARFETCFLKVIYNQLNMTRENFQIEGK